MVFKIQISINYMNSSKFEIQISNSNTHALCQVPGAKLYFHKEENERCTRQRESQSEYYYMIKGQNCSDMSPHVTALVFETRLVLFNFIRSSLSAFSSTFTNHTPWIELLFFVFVFVFFGSKSSNRKFITQPLLVTIGWPSFWFN